VCINLRFPSAGETSGIAIRMMGIREPGGNEAGIGKTVVFSAGEEVSRYPENACLRVDPDQERKPCWRLSALAGFRSRAIEEIGRRAAAYIRREHALERVAGQYWDAILGRDQ